MDFNKLIIDFNVQLFTVGRFQIRFTSISLKQ